jgi:hypothetical protein
MGVRIYVCFTVFLHYYFQIRWKIGLGELEDEVLLLLIAETD